MRKLVSLCALMLTLAQVREPVRLAAQQQQTGSIEGVVLKFGTTEGIPRARVTLRTPNSANSQTVAADDGGKYTFRDLSPGQYRITVTRDGYVTGQYGQRSPNGPGVAITLETQQQIKDARIMLSPAGTISGRVLNRYGEAAANVSVQALRYSYQEGRRTLTPQQTITTNDLGEYRLFFMPPGQYIISAQPPNPVGVDPGGTVFMQTQRGPGGPAILQSIGAQLGVGGVTQITISGANTPGPTGAVGGPGGAGPALPVPPPPPPPPPPPSAMDDSGLFLPVYYPGTTDVTAASPVDLRSGGNVGGINLTVVEARPVRVRGQVINGGRPAAGAQVLIFLRDNPGGSLTVRSVPVNPDTGTFEFRNMAPGAYEVVASTNTPGPGAMIAGTPLGNAAGINPAVAAGRGGRDPEAPVLGARTPVEVLNADVEGISLLMEAGFHIQGHIAFDRQTPNTPGLLGLRIQLQSEPMIPQLSVPAVMAEADGTFSFDGVTPGTYKLSVAGLPRNTYVKSARLGGMDMLNGGLRLDSAPGGPLEIALGNAPASLDATVFDSRQTPTPAVTVALVPEGAQQKRYDVYRSSTTDAQGKVHIEGIVPGEYKVYAWESVEDGAWADPDFVRNYPNTGVTVRLPERATASADVRVIPFQAN